PRRRVRGREPHVDRPGRERLHRSDAGDGAGEAPATDPTDPADRRSGTRPGQGRGVRRAGARLRDRVHRDHEGHEEDARSGVQGDPRRQAPGGLRARARLARDSVGCLPMWGRIILGTDGSPAANRAGEVAATVARAASAKLIATTGYATSPDTAEQRLGEALDAAEASGMRRARLDSEAVAGRAGDVLVAVAEEQD